MKHNMKRCLYFIIACWSLSGSAQVTDNFADGDITVNPTWSGDLSDFITNPLEQLQLTNTIAATSALSTATFQSSLNNVEWNFYIKLPFSPSSSNYARFYLASDQSNLKGSLNGYYVQFGESGSLDAVQIFRQNGTSSVSVCRGIDGLIANSFAIGVRVTRNASGLWSLYVDPAGGTNYNLQATGTDATYTTGSFFGMTCVYTISNATKFYFDDVYQGSIIVDTAPPTIVSTTVISSTQLDVVFNESVDLTTSQVLSNYSANNGLGNPTTATRDASVLSKVHLTFANAFAANVSNTLTVTNVQDLNGNAITSVNTNFTYVVVFPPAFKDVIINEIFADPSPQVALPTVEFIEIYNKSSTTYNLQGWKLTDGSATATLGNYNLVPNGYLILCPINDTAQFTQYGQKMGLVSFPSLNNSGDNLKLLDNTLAAIDSVNYSDTWYQDVVKKDGGWTLELINPNYPLSCSASGNWRASYNSNGGTPNLINSVYSTAPDVTAPSIAGALAISANTITVCFSEALSQTELSNLNNYLISGGIGNPISVAYNSSLTCITLTTAIALQQATTYSISLSNFSDCFGNALLNPNTTFTYYVPKTNDIVINEIMADPDPFVNLPNYEYVELYNRSPFAISLAGWTFSAGTNTKALPDYILNGNSYVVFASTSAAPNYPASQHVIGVTSFPALTNSGQTLTVKDVAGNVISNVSYNDTWYQNTAKADGGWSLEQIDPNNPCGGIENWRASVNPFGGTPGEINSVNATNADLAGPSVSRAAVVSTDTVQVFFNEPLAYSTLTDTLSYVINNGIGYPYSIKIMGNDNLSVKLSLRTNLQPQIIYQITVGNTITDCVGNVLNSDNNTALFAIPDTIKAGDIIINEILSDPKTGGYDFVEIYNNSNKVFDLQSLRLSQYDRTNNVPTSIKIISNEGYLFFPQQYLVLTANSSVVKSQYYTTNPKAFLDLSSMITMSIDSGSVCLSTTTDIVDLFFYTEAMQFPLLNSSKGVSLERIDFNRPTKDANNWHSAAEAVGFGTPGYKNSQYNEAGTAETDFEIMPEVFSPDMDGYNDIVNLNYKFDTPGYVANVMIYDSKGRLVRNLVRNELLGTNGTFSWDGINETKDKERIGIYVFYIEVFDLKGNLNKYKKTCVLASKLD
jgi:Lamin Tail Domain/Bacterial Ig-like domain/CHU_C Type IX secretion signal domain